MDVGPSIARPTVDPQLAPNTTTCPTIHPSIATTTMPQRRNKKAERYDSYEEKISKAIYDLKENPKAKLKHIAACHGLNRKTLYNFYNGKTHAVRAAHPECRTLSDEEEKGIEDWVEKRDALGHLPKHKELMRL